MNRNLYNIMPSSFSWLLIKTNSIKWFCVLYLFFTSIYCFGNNYSDSLYLKLKNAHTDAERITINLSLSRYFQQKETYKAFAISKETLILAKQNKNELLIADSYTELGLCYSFKSIADTAAIYFDSAYAIYDKIKSKEGLASIHLYMGENLSSTASWDKALSHFLKSIDNYQLVNDKHGLAKNYGKISQVLVNMSRLDEAMLYAKKGMAISESIKTDKETANLYNLVGVAFDYKGELDSALLYYNKSLMLNYKLNSKYDAAIALMNIGVIYLSQGKFKKSEESTLDALKLMIELDEQGSVAACYVNLGEIYSNQGLYSKSIEYLDKGIKMLYVLNRYDFLLEALRIKASVLKLNKNFEQALIVFEKYTLLKDSLFDSESNRNLSEMQAKFKNKEQEVEIKLHQAETARQKSINNFVIGIVALMILIAAFLIYAYRDKKKANTLLHLQKLEIEKQKEKVDEAYAELHEKNKEILDSIYYARRIQRALLTSEKYIERNLNKLIKKL
jgi:tetratricopeptide (TPR) repeat protein